MAAVHLGAMCVGAEPYTISAAAFSYCNVLCGGLNKNMSAGVMTVYNIIKGKMSNVSVTMNGM